MHRNRSNSSTIDDNLYWLLSKNKKTVNKNHDVISINIYQQVRDEYLVIWDQYLSKNMKWKFAIEYGINIYQKHGMNIRY